MKLVFTNYFIAFIFCFCTFSVLAQQPTANESVQSYTSNFEYGSNLGYYSNGWTDKLLVTSIDKAGGNTIRPTLPETFVDKWGYPIRLSEFQYYANELGMKDITCFIEGPSDAHRDKTIYPGCTSASNVFANLYEPIWNADGTVNTNNYYANYVYKLVQTYGAYIRNWEVVNEPDLGANNPSEWLTRAPLPSELSNLRAPFYNYIRMLRITWEVVKKYNPDDFVTPGGIGHTNFLDALLRYTDNPNGGTVTSQYPNKGGAYFDMLSYHVYPTFYLRVWDNSIKGFKYLRNSDYAATQIVNTKNELEAVLLKYGYNGATYPKKHIILTETNISRRAVDWRYSSDDMQRNFTIKSLVLAQKNNIKQYYLFSSGESVNTPSTETVTGSTEYALMGLYENLKRDVPGSEKLTPQGKGFKTTSMLLHDYKYDAAGTTALNLPANVEGGAFKKDGEFVYVLWAKNPNDKSETFSHAYSFPSALNVSNVYRYEWDYSVTGKNTQQSPTGITLNTAPSFFKANVSTVTKQAQSITFSDLADQVYGAAPISLKATASSGLAVSFKVVSGPATLSGSTLTLTGTGTVTVEASQSGNTTYNAAAVVSQSFLVNAASTTTASTKIEAEKYTSMSGIKTETTTDTGGGQNVGRLEVNNWVKYNVSVSSAGTYTFNFRVAGNTAGRFQVRNSSGTVLKTVDVPVTGGWQTWKTVSTSIALSSGSQTIQVYVTKNGWNFNWFEISNATTSQQSARSQFTEDLSLQKSLDETALNWSVYPNPVTTQATVEVKVPEATSVTLEVRDMQGKIVRQIFSGNLTTGTSHQFTLDVNGLAKGIYFTRLITPSKVYNEKIIVSE